MITIIILIPILIIIIILIITIMIIIFNKLRSHYTGKLDYFLCEGLPSPPQWGVVPSQAPLTLDIESRPERAAGPALPGGGRAWHLLASISASCSSERTRGGGRGGGAGGGRERGE